MRLPGRRTLIGAAVVALLVAGAGTALAVTGGDPYTVRTQSLTVDGVPEAGRPVPLDATLYLPQGAPPAPAVLLAHGFGGTKNDVADQARALAAQGYVVLAWTARGFGRSGGLIHLNAPDYEVKDAQKLVDLLAQRSDVVQDGPGDPRVGVAGGSYGGAISLLLAGYDRRVDAIAPQITWNELGSAIFQQSVVGSAQQGSPADPGRAAPPTVQDAGVFKKGWAGVFLGPRAIPGQLPVTALSGGSGAGASAGPSASPSAPRGPDGEDGLPPAALSPDQLGTPACGRLAPDVCSAYQQVATTGRPTPAMLDLLAASSPARVAGRITAPTLLIQGEADSLFPLSEADANATAIARAGTPVKVVWQGGGHDGGLDESERLENLTKEWFDRYLKKDGSAADTRFEVTVPAAAFSTENSNPAPQIRVAPAEPGVTGPGPLALQSFPLRGPEQVAVSPAGASPSALTSYPGIGAALSRAASAAGGGISLSSLPGQSAVFATDPLPQGVQVVGASTVRLRVSSTAKDATLFVSLQDLAPSGSTTQPNGLVSPVYLPDVPSGGMDVTVRLPGIVRDVAAGSRLLVVVATTDQAFFSPADGRQYRISLAGADAGAGAGAGQVGAVTVPTVATTVLDAGGLSDLLPWALALLAVVAVLAALAVLARRRTRGDRPVADLAHVPLRIEGLGKAYADGYRAVTDVSFTVEHGWVLGLLGPNGAGKTTTLRMLMGLIRPTEGEIRVFGHRITPGAAVLSRVGAFVEGPGFLPHVSGLENLRLYWQATGRPMSEARLDDALEVAGLGDDVHRRVKTYSQGMRQRLAIAQAMLGLPDLLVLDEPTNGLDPPQIREMREVLGRYAATGRTVVVSSHLLAEVEQTCTHVVVMHQGRLVAQGPVAELVGAATTLVLDVDDPAAAARVAADVPGARDVEQTPNGLVLKLVGTSRSTLVRALVDAGIGVDRITPQRGLEEAFLSLVGES